MALPHAILLMGPTAAGKTDLALELVQRLPCDIVSVDSALIYRGMDIGTAKPDAATLALAPHQLVDICDPAESYSAAQFCHDAKALMAQISSRGRIPLLVGGTMMYYQALVHGLAPMPASDPQLRARLQAEAERDGLAALHLRLQQCDPQAAARIRPSDPQRLLRALEVFEQTGESLSAHWARQQDDPLPYQLTALALWPEPRALLHQRIEVRFNAMLEQGFEAEVAALKARGDLHLELPSMRCVGYRQMWQYLDGAYDRASMIHKGVVATRQLAKRQLTWLRSWPDLQVLDPLAPNCASNALKLLDRIPT